MTTKRIVCLANSRKLSGRCVAGRELVDGTPADWIRPVSARPHQEVSEYERQYEDGSDPRVLDVIDVPLLEWEPSTYQQENWLLDPDYYWIHAGSVAWGELDAYAGSVGPLWENGYSTYHGLNDRIPTEVADTLSSSLVLVHVPTAELRVLAPGEAFGDAKRRVQAVFSYGGNDYRLRVTDPVYEREYLARPNGRYQIGEAFLTISLGEAWKGYCYKLIAAIIEPSVNPGNTG
jgi:hypothetical protein